MELPTGTVTFLISDIEGSTRLAANLGPDWPAVLGEHAALIRQAVAAEGGIEVSTEGDSFFCVFVDPEAALRAAVGVVRSMATHGWPEEGRVSVRIGLHTGDGVLGGDNYVGLDVHRAARIAAAGHGGQILLAEATSTLVENHLPDGVHLRRLGRYRLRDLNDPERLSQVLIDGFSTEFAPLRTLEVTIRVPIPRSTLVGREEEIEQVSALLDDARMVTLTGPGGTGKSRLAIAVAHQMAATFPDGVFFVPLDSVTDSELVADAILAPLGVASRGATDPLQQLEEYLEGRRVLLVLDNFEHLLGAAEKVAALLEAAPRLGILATSRAPLRIRAEHEVQVPPLQVPDADDPTAIWDVEAVRLFVERAPCRSPRFRHQRGQHGGSGGIGDASRWASPGNRAGCRPGQTLPTGDPARATRLEPRCSGRGVARSPCSPADARRHDRLELRPSRTVCPAATPPSIGFQRWRPSRPGRGGMRAGSRRRCPHRRWSRSSISHWSNSANVEGVSRFWMLETIKQFARDELDESHESGEVGRRHAIAYLALAERAAPELTRSEWTTWLARLDLDQDNMRAAINWAVQRGEAEISDRLLGALWRFFQIRGHLAEARRLTKAVLAVPATDLIARARAYEGAGGVAYWASSSPAEAEPPYLEALRLWREIGDESEVANALYNAAFPVAYSAESGPEGIARSRPMLAEARELYERLGDDAGVARVLLALGTVIWVRGDPADLVETVPYFEQSAELSRATGDVFQLGWALRMVGRVLIELGRTKDGADHLAQAVEVFAPVNDVSALTVLISDHAALAIALGDLDAAMRLDGATSTLRDSSGANIVDFRSHERAPLDAIAAEMGDRAQRLL